MMLNLIILVQGIFTAIALAMGDTILAGRMSFYTPQWDGWVKHTARWSAYCAPTFSSVFTPQTEEELSQGVCKDHPGPSNLTFYPLSTSSVVSTSCPRSTWRMLTLRAASLPFEQQYPLPGHKSWWSRQCALPRRIQECRSN